MSDFLHRALGLLTVLGLILALAACQSGPRVWNCPQNLPGAAGQPPIPVILTVDDTGRAATPQQVQDQNGPELACEADANRNGVGDETEVEIIEEAQNTSTDD